MFGIFVACQSTKSVDERFGEILLTQMQLVQPNIFVDKSDERLYVVRNGEFLTIDEEVVYWDISLGTVPEGHKQREGDKKTPEGLYRYTDYNSSSSYHGSLLIHYPNPIDATAAVEDGRITVAVQK